MYTVKQVADITGISAHTIRFYDKEGLFPFVSRDENNVRLFSEDNLNWINIVYCLREIGMPLAGIKQYIELCKQGKSTAEERYNIMMKQKEKAEHEVIKMQQRVGLLKNKTDYYKIRVEQDGGDFWNPVNCTEASQDNKH